ncbi:4'-phosphopantetheinyl transferase family protein [Tunicatimonas pelagia]|uniref:4'-phosphopantetheinyl transferase family protein n=1 Tax=Tunicatimonas pelagia TaxID=931531 RepID=UPI002664E684|nr:4'-phosphopantetheinyl transferase superfamily protein [Tunicatimonas pelagia]WKN45982.1 4'-phosphopantetheinyl transferase superfamily protein [Tunicatimonas pelagia]
MALVKLEKVNQNSSWALWKIDEDFNHLVQQTRLHSDDLSELEDIHHPRKKLEWLSSRAALSTLLQAENYADFRIWKDEKGKPYLLDNSYHISLANSFPYGAAIIHRHQPVGIDIEKPSTKLLRVKHKFLNSSEAEEALDNLDKLCIYWAVKESLYKLYGRKQLSLKQNIKVGSPTNRPVLASILLEDQTTEFRLDTFLWDEFYVVFSHID